MGIIGTDASSYLCMNQSLPLVALLMALRLCMADSSPVEAGKVTWLRDLNAALSTSQTSGKPIFALFQEIPGCVGCQQFGKEVLSDALLVEAIESEFTPLLIHNNKAGQDAEALKRFGEPAWNYPVVRFLNRAGQDIIPRRDQVWDTGGIATRMITTLEIANRIVPAYLRVLAHESSAQLQQAVYATACFWTGELRFGQVNGVITTEAGFANGQETVLLRYDPAQISLPQLDAEALNHGFTRLKKVADFRMAPVSDQKKQIEGTPFSRLSLSLGQATKVNAWVRVDEAKALSFLSPTQAAGLRH